MKTVFFVRFTASDGGAESLIPVACAESARTFVAAHALRNGWSTARFTVSEHQILDLEYTSRLMAGMMAEIPVG